MQRLKMKKCLHLPAVQTYSTVQKSEATIGFSKVLMTFAFRSHFLFFNIVYIFPVFSGCILMKTLRNKHGLS